MFSPDQSSLRDPQDFISWLDHLRLLHPPIHHLVVGAGTGSRDWPQYLHSRGDRHVTLVEADESKLPLLERKIVSLPEWKICNHVLAPIAGEVTFYHASLASESGLLPPESLRAVWPNLTTVRTESRQALSLECLLRQSSLTTNWLWLDCYPALPFLAADGNHLDEIEVIVVRALLEPDGFAGEYNTESAVQSLLEGRSYRMITSAPSIHPKIGYAIFLRDRPRPCGAASGHSPEMPEAGDSSHIPPHNESSTGQHSAGKQVPITSEPIPAPCTDEKSLTFYISLPSLARDNPPPFLLIDSKSIPRSGVHHLKNTMSRLLGAHFSFCEWYREVGCCKRRPCSLTGFAQPPLQSGQLRIRLIKSHDFSHTGPILPTSPHLHRLVLVRDPLYVLTSWFELEQLTRYSHELALHGIQMPKIWLSHEPEVLASAYQILDQCFQEPSRGEITDWLAEKSNYITRFLNQWVVPHVEHTPPYAHLIGYSEINSFIVRITEPYHEWMSEGASRSLRHFADTHDKTFKTRTDPLRCRTRAVTMFLKDHGDEFHETAERILEPLSPQIREFLQ